MSTNAKAKRQYTRLSDEDWATIRSEWEEGHATLADLSNRFGASIRSLQLHFEKHGSVKGSARRTANFDAIRLAATPEPFPADAAHPETVKASALSRILTIEDAISDQLTIMRTDPSQAFRCGSTVKALQAAVDALAKAYSLKREVLGLDRVENRELPVLTIRELFPEEIERLQSEDDDDDGDLWSLEDDDQIVSESPA